MIWPLNRIWCEVRAWHPTAIWASEWTYGQQVKSRTVQSRCSDCGWIRWTRIEAATAGAGSDGA